MADFINKADFIENLSEYDKTALDDLKIFIKISKIRKHIRNSRILLDLKDELKKNRRNSRKAKGDFNKSYGSTSQIRKSKRLKRLPP